MTTDESKSGHEAETEAAASQPSTEAQDGENLQTPDTPDPAPRGLKGSGLRYTASDGVPAWAVGLSADEILEHTNRLLQTVESLQVNTPQTPQTPPEPDIPPVDWNNLDGWAHRVVKAAREAAKAEVDSAAPAVMAPLAEMAKRAARTYKPDVWEHYAGEIEQIMSSVPERNRASEELWKQAVDMIAGRHSDERARRLADEILARGTDNGTMPDGAGGVTNPQPGSSLSPIRKLFATNDPAIHPYKADGLTAEDVIRHAAQMGINEEKRAEQLIERSSKRISA